MLGETCVVTRLIKICRRLHCEVRGHRTERRVFDATGSVLTHGPRARLSNGPRSASSDGKVCMAEVCLTAPAVLFGGVFLALLEIIRISQQPVDAVFQETLLLGQIKIHFTIPVLEAFA